MRARLLPNRIQVELSGDGRVELLRAAAETAREVERAFWTAVLVDVRLDHDEDEDAIVTLTWESAGPWNRDDLDRLAGWVGAIPPR